VSILNIRKAKIEDVDGMCHLNSLLNRCHAELDAFWTLKKDSQIIRDMCVQYFRKMIRSSLSTLFIAEDNGQIVGYSKGTLKSRPPIFQVSAIGQLDEVYVMKLYRRRGIGRQLTDALIEWFRSKQVEYIEVNSDVRNSNALNAWEKYGFKQAMIKMRKNVSAYK
jgi:ribosomal protein S18 acetylase RimI-like enzyme